MKQGIIKLHRSNGSIVLLGWRCSRWQKSRRRRQICDIKFQLGIRDENNEQLRNIMHEFRYSYQRKISMRDEFILDVFVVVEGIRGAAYYFPIAFFLSLCYFFIIQFRLQRKLLPFNYRISFCKVPSIFQFPRN